MFAQEKISIVENPDFSNMPDLNLTLNYYYPYKVKENFIKVEEENQNKDFTYEITSPVPANSNKTVLILFEKMHNEYNQVEFYNKITKKTIDKWMKPEDKINIAYFDRNKDGKTFLKYALDDYTSDLQQVKDILNKNTFTPDSWNTQQSSELYSAIMNGLKDINSKTDVPEYKMIVVFTAGYNLPASNSPDWQALADYSIKNKIPIYIIQYFLWENRSQRFLAENSYGRFAITHNSKEAQDSLTYFMQNSLKTIRGYNYNITFKSSFKADNSEHDIAITIKDEKLLITAKYKCESIKCFIKNNLIIDIIILILVLGFILFIVLRKNKKEKIKHEIFENKEEPKKEKIITAKNTIVERKETSKPLTETKKEIKFDNIEEYKIAKGQYPRIFIGKSYFEIKKNIFIVGRGDTNDLTIEQNYISRQHFRIFYKDKKFFIEDLNSTNGTALNNKQIKGQKAIELKDNDVISILDDLKIIFKM